MLVQKDCGPSILFQEDNTMKAALALITALALMETALGGETPRDRSMGNM
jgi:hypothetical protein